MILNMYRYSYFKSEPIIELMKETHADKDANITTINQLPGITAWSKVINSLINSR